VSLLGWSLWTNAMVLGVLVLVAAVRIDRWIRSRRRAPQLGTLPAQVRMRRSPAEYKCQAFPDGTWTVLYIHPGGERCETVGGRVSESEIAVGESLLQAAEREARTWIERRKVERARQQRLIDGGVTFTVPA
jgi:hypothetical protein